MLARTQTHRPVSLFTKNGGFRTLRAVIFDFYDRVLDSDVVGHFFENVDLAKLVDHQTKFFASILGGPVGFVDQRLANAHAHLHVTDAHFDEIVSILKETLQDVGFTHEDLSATIIAVEARRPLIVKPR